MSNNRNRQVIAALQPLSGFENNSTIENQKIKKIWELYPRTREVMRLVAKNNNADFLDLSIIFKEEKNANINFFDKTHLTETGQRKVANVLMGRIKSFKGENLEHADYFKLRQESIKKILTQDFSGKYKTVEDY